MSETIDSKTSEPSGIGGWLVLPIIGMFLSILLTAVNLLIGFRDFATIGWSTAYAAIPALTVFSGLSFLMGAAMIGLAIFCLSLIFRRDWRAPKYAILFFILIAVIGTFEGGLLCYFAEQLNDPTLVEDEPKDTIRAWVGCAIWVPYFLKSKRVKNTFVERG